MSVKQRKDTKTARCGVYVLDMGQSCFIERGTYPNKRHVSSSCDSTTYSKFMSARKVFCYDGGQELRACSMRTYEIWYLAEIDIIEVWRVWVNRHAWVECTSCIGCHSTQRASVNFLFLDIGQDDKPAS